ncbi:MAG: FHA domain-containing protein [Anaerolineaceae bacterium]|jgi:hypothetical protein
MKTPLDAFESRLQKLIEGIPQVLWINPTSDFAHKVIDAMQTALGDFLQEHKELPGIFILHIHPDTLLELQTPQDLLDNLTQAIKQAAVEQGISFKIEPTVRFEEDTAMNKNDIRVSVREPQENHGHTVALDVSRSAAAETNTIPLDAYLIIEGKQTFPLTTTIVNIGRRDDNHLVLEDMRVSRTHAQLRAVKGRYVIFDLNSTGGTFLNGQRISQATLSSGDIISLAGLSMIYSETRPDLTDDTDRMAKP